jgi:hypothetical protein
MSRTRSPYQCPCRRCLVDVGAGYQVPFGAFVPAQPKCPHCLSRTCERAEQHDRPCFRLALEESAQ